MPPEAKMNGNNDNFSLDEMQIFTRKQLDRLIAGDLYMEAGLQESDLLNLTPNETTDKRKKNRLSNEFRTFCQSLLQTAMSDKSISSHLPDKQKKKLLKKAFSSNQDLILQVIGDYIGEKMDIPKGNTIFFTGVANDNEEDVANSHNEDRSMHESSVSDTGLDEESNDEELSKPRKKKTKKKKVKREKKRKKIRTKHYDDDSDDERESNAESDEEIPDFNVFENNPLLEKAKERFEAEKKSIMDRIPDNIKKDFRQIAFTKWGKQTLPVIQLGPFDVEPGSVRNSWLKMFNNCMKSKRNPSRLIMWYGTVWENRGEAYSFVAKTKLTSYEGGKAKGFDQLPKVINKKISEGKELTDKENFYVQGLDQMKKDLELPPEQRIQWMSRFTENYEDYLYDDDDEKSDVMATSPTPPQKGKRKLTKMNRKKKAKLEKVPSPKKTPTTETSQDDEFETEADTTSLESPPKKRKSKQKKKVEVEFTEEVEHELMLSGGDNVKEDKENKNGSRNDDEETDSSSYKHRKLKKSSKEQKVKRKKKKVPEAEDDKNQPGKRKKQTIQGDDKPSKTKKMRMKIEEDSFDGNENAGVPEEPHHNMEKLFHEEQMKFEECERVINPILQKLTTCIKSKDDREVIGSIEKMESNLTLLTKAYIEYANMGPLMKTLKKTFKHSSPKVFEKCKNCISKLRDLYGRGSMPEGFAPTPTRGLFCESKKVKEEPTSDPISVHSSTAISDPAPVPAQKIPESPISSKENDNQTMTIVNENIALKKNASSFDNGQRNSQPSKNPEPQPSAEPKRRKPKFSLLNMIEGTKKNVDAEPVKSSQVRENKKTTNTSPIPVRKQTPKWLTDKPDTFDIPLSNDDHIFALQFLEDAMLSFPVTINREYAARALEEATRRWSTETDRFKKWNPDNYWEKIHDLCGAFKGMTSTGRLVKAIMEGEYTDPMSVVKLSRKALYESFCL